MMLEKFRGESQGATPSMNPANLGLCPPLLQTCGSLLPPTPLHKGQNVHFVYEAIPKLDIYFLYLYLQHIDLVFCISVAMKVREERVNAALGVNPQF